MLLPLAFVGRNSEYSVTLKKETGGLLKVRRSAQRRLYFFKSRKAVNLRLRSSSEAKAYHAPQEQEPAIHRSKGAQQTEVQSPAHGQHQTLVPTGTNTR